MARKARGDMMEAQSALAGALDALDTLRVAQAAVTAAFDEVRDAARDTALLADTGHWVARMQAEHRRLDREIAGRQGEVDAARAALGRVSAQKKTIDERLLRERRAVRVAEETKAHDAMMAFAVIEKGSQAAQEPR